MPAVVTNENPPYETLRTPSGVDDWAAIQGAVNRFDAGVGGRLILGPGTWRTSQTVTLPDDSGHPVTLMGAGMRSTTLRRTTDVILVDCSGEAGGAGAIATGHQFQDMAFSANNTGTQPLIRMYYAGQIHSRRIRIRSSQGLGIDGVQVWDSYWDACRFEELGSDDGTVPAVRFACRTSDTAGAMGYSTDSNNQLDFDSCVLESGRGGFWFVRNAEGASGSIQNNHTINFRHAHLEQASTAGPYLRLHGTNRCSVSDTMVYVHTLANGASAVNAIEVGASGLGASSCSFSNVHLHGSNASNTHRCLIRAEAGAGISLINVTGDYSGSGKGPTVALIDWQGTNNFASVKDVRWLGNVDNTPLFNNAPTSFAASMWSMPVISGAGRTTLADSDFPNAIWDNRVALVKNTSDGRIRLGVRDGGTWKHVELT